jgi:hypothetical protein
VDSLRGRCPSQGAQFLLDQLETDMNHHRNTLDLLNGDAGVPAKAGEKDDE